MGGEERRGGMDGGREGRKIRGWGGEEYLGPAGGRGIFFSLQEIHMVQTPFLPSPISPGWR